VQTQTRKRVAKNELSDIQDHLAVAPLVVQLIGNDPAALAEAALLLQAQGIQHLNLNLGCPYGRMTTGATGGELLRQPQQLALMLMALRRVCRGSFSVKCRAGYDDLNQWQMLLPLFEDSGVDFIVLHPRTVVQRYNGAADHRISAAMAAATSLPVIANGDINSAQEARILLARTDVAGLMIGRAAQGRPWIFRQIRQYLDTCAAAPGSRSVYRRLVDPLSAEILWRTSGADEDQGCAQLYPWCRPAAGSRQAETHDLGRGLFCPAAAIFSRLAIP